MISPAFKTFKPSNRIGLKIKVKSSSLDCGRRLRDTNWQPKENSIAMMILNNEEVSDLLSMDKCLRHLEAAYRELSEGGAVNRPRSDLYLPATTTGGVYCFKTMEGGLTREKVVALRLNSDVIKWEEKGGRIVKDKVPAAPGNKWVGLVLLFSAESGEPLAIFPDGIIQGIRVAASSALAARYLARYAYYVVKPSRAPTMFSYPSGRQK